MRTNHQRDHGCRQTVTDKNLNLFQNQFLQYTMIETSKDPACILQGLAKIYIFHWILSPYLTQNTYYFFWTNKIHITKELGCAWPWPALRGPILLSWRSGPTTAMISGTLVGDMQMWSSDQWQQAKPLTVDQGQAAKLLGHCSEWGSIGNQWKSLLLPVLALPEHKASRKIPCYC